MHTSSLAPFSVEVPEDWAWKIVGKMGRHQIEDLEAALYFRKMELSADRLRVQGFSVVSHAGQNRFTYLVIGLGNDSEMATLEKAENLLAIRHNLPNDQAWERWVWQTTPKLEDTESAQVTGSTLDDRAASRAAAKDHNAYLRELKHARDAIKAEARAAGKNFVAMTWQERKAWGEQLTRTRWSTPPQSSSAHIPG